MSAPTATSTASVLELVAEAAADGQTEVTILIPRREYRSAWHRLPPRPHRRTTSPGRIGDVPHANVTFVPYHLTQTTKGQHVPPGRARRRLRDDQRAERPTDTDG